MQVMHQVTDLNPYSKDCLLVQISLAFHQVKESISLKIFFNEITAAAIFFQIIHQGDTRMAQGSQKKGFPLKLLISG